MSRTNRNPNVYNRQDEYKAKREARWAAWADAPPGAFFNERPSQRGGMLMGGRCCVLRWD